MKALGCAGCVDIRALPPDTTPISCRCGNVEARWRDPVAGTVYVRAVDRSTAFVVGFHNGFLRDALTFCEHPAIVDEGWRAAHDRATDAPGYLFDKHHRRCWACVIRVGETNDIAWWPEDES